MERKSSPWATGLAVAGLLAVLLAGYGAAYWWRLPAASTNSPLGSYDVDFPSLLETRLFRPAVWLHRQIHSKSLYGRVMVFPGPKRIGF